MPVHVSRVEPVCERQVQARVKKREACAEKMPDPAKASEPREKSKGETETCGGSDQAEELEASRVVGRKALPTRDAQRGPNI